MNQREKPHFAPLFFIPAMLCLSFVFPAAHAETLTGKVVKVADGDTLTLLDEAKQQHKIRLGGIDAPEKAQPFGQKSKDHLAKMVFGKAVTADCRKTDRYKRSICMVFIDGADAGQAQIEVGPRLVVSEIRARAVAEGTSRLCPGRRQSAGGKNWAMVGWGGCSTLGIQETKALTKKEPRPSQGE